MQETNEILSTSGKANSPAATPSGERAAVVPEAGCPVCSGLDSRLLVECAEVPVLCNVLARTRLEALQVSRGRMRLVVCPTCGMIYNAAFESQQIAYSSNYENAQHFSLRFRRYLEQLAIELVTRYELTNKDIVEIGCGDARFLAQLCRAGNNRGVGFDPGAAEQLAASTEASISIVREPYTEAHATTAADFICCRHVLEHIPEPRMLLTTIRRALTQRKTGLVYFEVPNALLTVRDLAIWDLLYEHCLYFCDSSLTTLFTECGFDVMQVRENFDGQFLSVVAQVAERQPRTYEAGQRATREWMRLASEFQSHFTGKVQRWEQHLQQLFDRGQQVAVWGAGSKGVMFLNTVPGGDRVPLVIDVNPRKTGCYVAGTGQQIMHPSQLGEIQPDVVLVMNRIYQDEIRAELKRKNVTAQILLV